MMSSYEGFAYEFSYYAGTFCTFIAQTYLFRCNETVIAVEYPQTMNYPLRVKSNIDFLHENPISKI